MADRMRLLADMLENGIDAHATLYDRAFTVTMTEEQARNYLRFILTDDPAEKTPVYGFHAEGDCP